jgi:hypothetical protein
MPALYRSLLSSVLACLALTMALPACAEPATDAVDVTIRIQDEAGQPLPYVTVWGAVEPGGRQAADRHKFLTVDDLWRATQRYGELHEVISRYGDKPIESLRVPVMGDAAGSFHESLDYGEALGLEGAVARPVPLVFGYTFIKRGYLPGRVGFSLGRGQNQAAATVTLRRNPAEALETVPYRLDFARLRHALSDDTQDAELTEANLARVTALHDGMAAAAQQALAAGDKATAVRIYSRMRYLPTVIVRDGRITGWNHGDPGSDEAKQAFDQASKLAPDDLYVWMQTYHRRRALLPTPTMEERVAASLFEVERLIAAKGEAVWPQFYLQQARGHQLLGRFETAWRLMHEAARRDPAYTDWDAEIGKLKADMKEHGVPIPAK